MTEQAKCIVLKSQMILRNKIDGDARGNMYLICTDLVAFDSTGECDL
jgi:hypothetical protein